MDQLRRDDVAPALERDRDGHHLGDEVSVAEAPAADGAAPRRVDSHSDRPHVRLEQYGFLDRAGQARGGAFPDRRAEVLMEHSPELDAGLEEQRLAVGERRAVEVGRSVGHGEVPPATAGCALGTVDGPIR
ncbi:MAG: hypothetical protein L3K18_07240 [Thermoplasmata archaeon]|nr:hypothetical protein [Thermoplasmata archaeon]